MNEMIDRMANGLIGLGLKGDRVAIHMDNCPSSWFHILGFSEPEELPFTQPHVQAYELEYEINDTHGRHYLNRS